jgi:hypothetical protein
MRALLSVAVLLAMPALAQTQPQPSVTITDAECRNLTIHTPSPDVKYRPGVDAQGRAVAPADVGNRQRFQPPKEVTIDVTRQLNTTSMQALGIGGSELKILQLKVRDGRVYYNDQPLGDRDQRAIAQACAEMARQSR